MFHRWIQLFIFVALALTNRPALAEQPLLEDIQFESSATNEERITFKLNGAYIPKIFAIKDEKPRVVFDFPETKAKILNNIMQTNGKFIKQIRVGIHEGKNPKTRVVLDLLQDKQIDFEQKFDQKTNALVIRVYYSGEDEEQEAQSETAEQDQAAPPAVAAPEQAQSPPAPEAGQAKPDAAPSAAIAGPPEEKPTAAAGAEKEKPAVAEAPPQTHGATAEKPASGPEPSTVATPQPQADALASTPPAPEQKDPEPAAPTPVVEQPGTPEPAAPTPVVEQPGTPEPAAPGVETVASGDSPAAKDSAAPEKKAPAGPPLLSAIEFDKNSNRGEMVLFRLNDFHPPIVFGIEEGQPRVVCDFTETKLGDTVKKQLEAGGRYVKMIRVGQHNKPDKVRVVMELATNNNYDLQQVFFKEDNLFVIIVNTIDSNQPQEPPQPAGLEKSGQAEQGAL